MTATNRDMILQSLSVLTKPDQVVELRVLNTGRTGTVSGYFDDMDALATEAAKWNGKAPGIYISLNQVIPTLLARAQNRAAPYAKQTTSDTDIIHRCWLPLDFDPVRPSGISSTDTEHETARRLALDVYHHLRSLGWPDPVAGDSGNGYHLLYRIDLPNDPKAETLVRQCIEAIAFRFSDGVVDIDRKVYNAARIWKLYGTKACKGDSTEDRPHRFAQLVLVPDNVQIVSEDQLETLAATLPKQKAPAGSPHSGERFNIDGFIRHHNLDVTDAKAWNGGRKWVFRRCPWNSDHTDRCAYILEHSSGAISAGCHHNGCAGNDWRSLRERLEPGCYDRSSRPPSTGTNPTAPRSIDAQCPPTPPGLLVLPSDYYSYTDAAHRIFAELAPTHSLFVRGVSIVELNETDHGPELSIMRPAAFQSRLDGLGDRVMVHGMKDNEVVLKPKRSSKQNAEVLLESREAREILPRIAVLAAAPVLIEHGGEARVLERGYHPECGGILVTGGLALAHVPLAKAVEDLRGLVCDFDFQTPGDESRALASFITPALKMGGLLSSPIPMDVAEAVESQSGKTLRQAITRTVYNERGYGIARRDGGVGSLDESIGAALLSGRAFVAMDNLRGRLDSQYLEAVITFPASIAVRVPHRGEVMIDGRWVTFTMTSNGVETTRDLANRSCIVRIKKRPKGYPWHAWPEGSLLAHVETNQAHYLGCVHAVVREWIAQGKPKTDEARHDMREWAGALDWIVQNIFGAAPLLDGHMEAQERVSNPALVWLRSVCIVVEQQALLDREISASAIWDLTQDGGIDLPRARGVMDDLAGRRYVGQLLAKVFRSAEAGTIQIDDFDVTRTEREEYSERDRKDVKVKRYRIMRSMRSMRSGARTSMEIVENDRSYNHRPHRPQTADSKWEGTI